jgi:hypothetical protein
MATQILKFWHQWSWAIHVVGWLLTGTVVVTTYGNAMEDTKSKVTILEQQHKEENLATRMAVQENTARDVDQRLTRMEMVEAKIFDRINSIGDRMETRRINRRDE